MSLPALLIAVRLAGTGAPPPDYRAELAARYAQELRLLAQRDGAEAVTDRAAQIESEVGPLVAVRYEAALAQNQAGLIPRALRSYGQVLELDPDHVGALYDRGELLLVGGAEADRARARSDLQRAESLRPDHWAVPYRLALLAGRDGLHQDMSEALTRSLRAGLDPGLLATDPAWDSVLRNPQTGPALLRFARTYGSDALVRQLERRTGTP